MPTSPEKTPHFVAAIAAIAFDEPAAVVDGNVVLTDAAGGTATVTATDVAASNGVIHVIDTVLMPQ